jgi:hypothetical protein
MISSNLNYTPVTLRLVEATMSGSRSKFPWSDEQIHKALKRRALPVYTAEEQKILWDLAIVGAEHIFARRAGGQKPKHSGGRAAIRRILIEEAYPELPCNLRKTPTGLETIGALRDILAEKYGFNYSVETIAKDIKKIGSSVLRRR